jgi:RNA polymerase sigma-70 factor (ECF subfamily)
MNKRSACFVDESAQYAADLPAGDTTSLTLLARVRQSDKQAWGRLVQLYGPLVFEWCTRAGLKPVDAADLGQEVFTRVWTSFHTFRRDRPGDTFRGWLRVITKRQILDFWRRQQRQVNTQAAEPAELANLHFEFPDEDDPEVLAQDRRRLYSRAVELLRSDFEPITVEVFWRVVVQGEAPVDVAALLKVSVNSVYIAKSRVLSKLRAELSDEVDSARDGVRQDSRCD